MSTAPSVVLVTGSSGALGSRVVDELVRDGRNVVAFDSRPSDEDVWDSDQVTLVKGDVRDALTLSGVLRSNHVDGVVHTAAILPGETTPLADVTDVNVNGAMVVAETCAHAGVNRLVFTSTKGVYEEFEGEFGHPSYTPISEDYPIIAFDNNHTLYNVTKVSAEYCLTKASALTGLPIAILRFANMYGPKRERHGARSIAGDVVAELAAGREVHVPSGGEQRFDLLYVRDAAKGVVHALDGENTGCRSYNIGSGTLVTLRDVAATARALIGDDAPEALIGPGLDPMGRGRANYGLLDIGRARRELAYEPTYDLRRGVGDYISMLH